MGDRGVRGQVAVGSGSEIQAKACRTFTMPSSKAFTQFQKVVNQYRKDHPRGGGSDAGEGGVSPVTALPTGKVVPRHPWTGGLTMARAPR